MKKQLRQMSLVFTLLALVLLLIDHFSPGVLMHLIGLLALVWAVCLSVIYEMID